MFQVAAGGTHSVVLTQDGHVWTWGQPWPPGDMYLSSLILPYFSQPSSAFLELTLVTLFSVSKSLLLYESKVLSK